MVTEQNNIRLEEGHRWI